MTQSRLWSIASGILLCFLVAIPAACATPRDRAALANAQEQQTPLAQAQSSQQSSQDIEAYTLSPELYEKAVRYSRTEYILYFADFAWGIIALLLVLTWKLAPRYRDWAERTTKIRFMQSVIFVPLLLLTLAVLELPVDIYGHLLSRNYGLSVQGWSSWAGDWAKSQILSFIFGIILVWILYAIIRHSSRHWWFYFWLAVLPIVFFVIFVSPIVIDPMFNRFEPLQKTDTQLVAALEEVVHRAGMTIPPERMFLMRASEKTREINAYVTGVGTSKRVVVWDTTIQQMTIPETMYVFGHEMGHYVLNHVYEGLIFGAIGAFVLLYLGFRGALWMLLRCSSGWSIRSTDDWASLPVLLLWIAILGFVSSPISNSVSRHMEHQADQYGLEVTHELFPNARQVAARSFQKLGEIDLADPNPNPFIKIWLFSHPPVSERVSFALTYDPWAHGRQPEFVKQQP